MRLRTAATSQCGFLLPRPPVVPAKTEKEAGKWERVVEGRLLKTETNGRESVGHKLFVESTGNWSRQGVAFVLELEL